LVFWTPEEQELLDDKRLVKLARKQFNEFVLEYETLKQITDLYPQYFNKDTVTFENA
jgi:hypothetical protein